MAYVYVNGKIIPRCNIPEVALDYVRDFIRKTDYKGDIVLPIGPYNHPKYYHVVQSLELLKMLGGIGEIMQIEIKKDALTLKLRSGESHTVLSGMLNCDSNLKKIAKSYKEVQMSLSNE